MGFLECVIRLLIGRMIFNSCLKEKKKQHTLLPCFFESDSDDDTWRLYCEDGAKYGLDPEDYDTEEEYEEALAEAKVAWRATCEDGFEFGLDPEDYDTEEEYEEALAEAKVAWRATCEDGFEFGLDPEDYDIEEEYEEALEEARLSSITGETNITITITVSFEMPGMEALNAIKPEDYPNERQYDAAYHLCAVEQDTAYIPSHSSREAEIEKCKFILAADTIAGKYLTVRDGFLYAQAIQEHFELPVEVEEEDREPKASFDDLFMKIVAEDAALALKIWVWCVQEFGPYQKYMRNDWSLYNSIIFYADDYPEEFLPLAIRELGTNTDFCRDVLTNSKQFPCGIAKFISKALELDLIAEAQMIFNAVVMNPVAKDKEIEDVIYGIISDCSTWKELENMEKFKFSFLPHIKRMNNKYIQQLYPKFLEQVDQYISIVESLRKKYRYSRKYAWRTTCEDGSEYGLNPLNYETVEEYNEALKKKRAKDREARRIPNLQDDPLATTDKTIYTFCSVVFPSSHQPYTYLTGEIEVKIGDTVVVPVGSKDQKAIATVVSISQHMRMTAPYPVEKAKKIIKKVEPTDSEKRLFDA